MNREQRNRIDAMTYEEMVTHRRFTPVENEMFQGMMGEYFFKMMNEKGKEITREEKIAISKKIGWD